MIFILWKDRQPRIYVFSLRVEGKKRIEQEDNLLPPEIQYIIVRFVLLEPSCVASISALKRTCKFFKIIVEQLFDHSFCGNMPLLHNIMQGNEQEINRLLQKIDYTKSRRILPFAFKYGCTSLVKLILDNANINPS